MGQFGGKLPVEIRLESNKDYAHMVVVKRSPWPFLALCLLFVHTTELFAQNSWNKHERNSWVVGIELGSWAGKYTGLRSKWNGSGNRAATFRLAYMIRPSFSLGIEVNSFVASDVTGPSCPLDLALFQCQERDGNFSADQNQTVKFGNFALAATFYPAGGLYLRVGFGQAIQRVKVSGDSSPFSGAYNNNAGEGLLLGAGYELRVNKEFALGFGVSFNKLTFGAGRRFADDAQLIGYGLNFNWYL